jgi:hypothetical protein
MAAPNLIAPASIYGKTDIIYIDTSSSSVTQLILRNDPGSNKTFKVNSLCIMFPNEQSYRVNSAGIWIYKNGTNPNSSSAPDRVMYDELSRYSVSHQNSQVSHYTPLTMPNQSNRWKIISKDEMIYLEEGQSIYLQANYYSGNNSYITVSYEEIR